MSRSPFQGTYQPGARPTIVTAPDALVYINGSSEAIGCPSCKKSFPFNKYITSIQVDLSVDSVPGSASITMAIPQHAIDDFFFEGDPIVMEMMEVEIFAKGHFLVEGMPQYYPIFWGLITEVTDSYSNGAQTVSIQCADILKWWEVCKMATNSAFTSPIPGQGGMSLMGNVFFGQNPYDMIWTLSQQAFGDVVVGTGSLVQFLPDAAVQRGAFKSAMTDIMLYWNQRFTRMRSNLLLYGTNGVAVRGDTLSTSYSSLNNKGMNLKNMASTAVRQANGGADAGQMIYDPADPSVVAFKTIFQVNVPFWQSEYQTKLELATATKDAIGFEFYMDVDGSIVFKPPFYNLDVLSNKPVSWIQDVDIIDWSGLKSEAEVVTQIQLAGSLEGNTDYGFGEETNPVTTVTDYHLLRQFGWRTQNYNSEFMSDPLQMFYHGMDLLDRLNSRRHRATVTIPLRSELRLGFPVYLAGIDQVWYVSGISHSIQFGGRAQTTLTLTAQRKKWIAPKGIGKMTKIGTSQGETSRQLQKNARFELSIQDAPSYPPTTVVEDDKPSPYDPLILRHPKTGRVVGFPNAVMVYTRPVKAPENVIRNNLGQRKGPSPQQAKEFQQKTEARNKAAQQGAIQYDRLVNNSFTEASIMRERHITNRYGYGMNSAGVYVYAHDTSKAINEILMLPRKSIELKSDPNRDTKNKINEIDGASALIRPVSDSRGFEVVGHYRYGRGVSLRDGRLILNGSTGVNDAVTITAQVAVSGDLYGMLTAQSQGIMPPAAGYENRADTLANLTVEDTQTGGFINPETEKPTFSSTGDKPTDTFVSVAPLGSPQQRGAYANVEAAQLSRALTLAEMTVGEKNSDSNCACILGRANLAFINFNYAGHVLNPSVSDGGSLAEGLKPIEIDKLDPTTLLSKIDAYLFEQYSLTDKNHSLLEDELRGLNLPVDPNSAADIRDGTISPVTPDLTPPFSAPNRFAIGDPKAAALQGDTASQQLATRWKQFGSDMKREGERAGLAQQISNVNSELIQARAQLERLEKSRGTLTEDAVAKAIGGQDYDTTVKNLKAHIASLEEEERIAKGKLALR